MIVFGNVENLLFQLMAEAKAIFLDAELGVIQRFIYFAEYGSALEAVIAIYLWKGRFISPKTLNLIECLGA